MKFLFLLYVCLQIWYWFLLRPSVLNVELGFSPIDRLLSSISVFRQLYLMRKINFCGLPLRNIIMYREKIGPKRRSQQNREKLSKLVKEILHAFRSIFRKHLNGLLGF